MAQPPWKESNLKTVSFERAGGAIEVLGNFHRRGVKLWAENGRLRYQGIKGALSGEDLQTLIVHKGELLALLSSALPMRVDIKPRGHNAAVPLTYSQLSHWHRYGLRERAHLRQLARAIRLSGPLDLPALRNSLAELVERHEALRIQLTVVDGVPMQKVCKTASYALEVADLSHLSDEVREHEARRYIEHYVGEPVNVLADPLFGARLLRLREDEHVLIAAMEHMISDGISLNIFMRDWFATYECHAYGTARELPAVAVPFGDYAVWQRDAERSRFNTHAEDWHRHMAGCPRVRFPEEFDSNDAGPGWAVAPVTIDRELREKLQTWCRRSGVTLPLTVFAAYIALMLRWCRADEMAVRYVTDGRITPDVEHTVGYFAYLLFLRVVLHAQDRPLDLIKRATEEYCYAQERPHLGRIEAQASLPEFARGCGFNWVPGDAGERRASQQQHTRTSVPFEHPMLRTFEQDIEPFVLFYDTAGGIIGSVHYPRARASFATMQRFSRNLRHFLEMFVTRPDLPVTNISLQP